MVDRRPEPPPAWLAVAALAALGTLLAALLPTGTLDWQPERAATDPWRAITAAWVHWSPMHLLANLAGVAVVAAFGHAAGLGRRAALAWLLAWPLTQAGLLAQPELQRYGGLSGVLHAGVAVGAGWLLLHAHGRARALGAAVAAGLALKLLLESPLGPPLQQVPGWDIPIAPFAHLCGALAGGLALALVSLPSTVHLLRTEHP